MKTVYKYPLAITDMQYVTMPRGARILAVQPQQDAVCLWALVDTAADADSRRIVILGTGHQAPDFGQLEFIATFQLRGGSLVFHAFELVDMKL